MINIANNDFNKDMDDYLTTIRDKDNKREPSFSGALKIFNVLRRRIPSDEEVERRELKRQNEREMEVMEDEIEEIHETEEVMEVQREGIVTRFLKKLRLSSRDEYIEDEEEMEVAVERRAIASEEKCKETIKIVHKWLEQLPPEKLDQFKRSEDFVKYKQTLKELGLIKQN